MGTKVRTQIQLDPEDLDSLRSFARRKGISVSGAVRLLVREAVAPSGGKSDWSRFMEFGGSLTEVDGRTDVAANHDRYLYGYSATIPARGESLPG